MKYTTLDDNPSRRAKMPLLMFITIVFLSHCLSWGASAQLLNVPVALLQGYNRVTGQTLNTAVKGKSESQGGQSRLEYTVCTDAESLIRALGVEQSGSIGFDGFGASGKESFVSRLGLTTYSTTIVIYARHILETQIATDLELLKPDTKLADPQSRRNFFTYYGDSVVNSVTRGGEYFAVYTFFTQTRQEQSSLVSSLKGAGLFDAVSFSASFQSKLDSFVKTSKTRLSLSQQISGLQNVSLPTPENLVKFAGDFLSLNIDAPEVIGFTTIGYEHVRGVGSFGPVADNRDYFVLGRNGGSSLLSQYRRIKALQNQIEWLLSLYDFYGGFEDEKLRQFVSLVSEDRRTVESQIQQYDRDPVRDFTYPEFHSLRSGTPSLAYSIQRSPLFGINQGGVVFDDVDAATALQRRLRLSTVQIRSGDWVNAIEVTYESDIAPSVIVQHGGAIGGEAQNRMVMLPGEFISSISGEATNRLNRIVIKTTEGQSTIGGPERRLIPFAFEIPKGEFALGFGGRAGDWINGIYIVYGRFKPATWR